MSTTALQALRNSGIHISSDTAEYHQIPKVKEYLSDATTNPSLVLAAVSKPEYASIVQEAVQFARQRLPSAAVNDVAALAMDRTLVLVGLEISKIIPGRVSFSVDPRIASDTQAMIRKGEALVALLEELDLPRHRILIKIPATYEGICAAQALEHPPTGERIHTNMTLVFGRVQALACAQAGLSVISPFIGRVKDWWDAQGTSVSMGAAQQPGLFRRMTDWWYARAVPALTDLAQHPGILLVQNIRAMYTAHAFETQIMAAGFRAVDEIVELGKYGRAGGPDVVTLPPHLLDGLRTRQNLAPPLKFEPSEVAVGAASVYFGGSDTAEGAAAYARDIMEEKIAAAKVPEGLAKFSADAQILEDLIKRAVIDST
ncbi:transaldolase [Mycena belliarum]|uniref:Transaldolase n=1 Tax=Mycena belliarum TaxID=1033014 RepID=A0AAD6UCW3_9AGAR|nr:transaldolase [Mycena belliae]